MAMLNNQSVIHLFFMLCSHLPIPKESPSRLRDEPRLRACCFQVTFRRATWAELSSKVLGEPSAKRPKVQLWVSWNPAPAG